VEILLENPLPLLTLNIFGLGIDVLYSKPEKTFTIQLNFVVGHVQMNWDLL